MARHALQRRDSLLENRALHKTRFYGALPVELLELVSAELERPQDLLQLVLSAKWLAALVISDHLDLREIMCGTAAKRQKLWKAMASNPLLASHVLSVHIVREGLWESCYLRLPRLATLAARSPDDFRVALHFMRNLRAFHWNTDESVHDILHHIQTYSPNLTHLMSAAKDSLLDCAPSNLTTFDNTFNAPQDTSLDARTC